MNKLPSEIIREGFPTNSPSQAYGMNRFGPYGSPHDSYNTPMYGLESPHVTCILNYLDKIIPELQAQIAELQKPKYACNMCNRVITEDEKSRYSISSYAELGDFNGCIHCKPEVQKC